jgi:hypothetical protein
LDPLFGNPLFYRNRPSHREISSGISSSSQRPGAGFYLRKATVKSSPPPSTCRPTPEIRNAGTLGRLSISPEPIHASAPGPNSSRWSRYRAVFIGNPAPLPAVSAVRSGAPPTPRKVRGEPSASLVVTNSAALRPLPGGMAQYRLIFQP